jgi:hypothetical protein
LLVSAVILATALAYLTMRATGAADSDDPSRIVEPPPKRRKTPWPRSGSPAPAHGYVELDVRRVRMA